MDEGAGVVRSGATFPPMARGYTSAAEGAVMLLSPSPPEQLKRSHQNKSHPGAWRGAGLARSPKGSAEPQLLGVGLALSPISARSPQSAEYKYNRQLFLRNARAWTEKYAGQQPRVGDPPADAAPRPLPSPRLAVWN